MKKNQLVSTLALISIILLAGCKSKTIERTAVGEQIDLSGRWNDSDSQLVSRAIIADIAKRPWIEVYTTENGKKPVVIVGTIRNKSSEHIETETFTKDLERELINNGRVKFVANQVERNELRQERQDQQSWSTEETQKRLAAETGADYMLQGSINTIIDKEGKQTVMFYQVDLEMIHLETNEKVWMGGEKIKKLITQRSTKW